MKKVLLLIFSLLVFVLVGCTAGKKLRIETIKSIYLDDQEVVVSDVYNTAVKEYDIVLLQNFQRITINFGSEFSHYQIERLEYMLRHEYIEQTKKVNVTYAVHDTVDGKPVEIRSATPHEYMYSGINKTKYITSLGEERFSYVSYHNDPIYYQFDEYHDNNAIVIEFDEVVRAGLFDLVIFFRKRLTK